MTIHTSVTVAAAPQATDTTLRHNVFTAMHKALRLSMAETLCSLGRLGIAAPDEAAVVGGQLGTLLQRCRHHLQLECRQVHPAVEARRPGATRLAAAQCADILDEIHALEADLAALRVAPTAARALQLYRHVALFVAASFQHMHVEETALNDVLWAEYGDAQLREFEQHLMASDEADTSAIDDSINAVPPPAPSSGEASGAGRRWTNRPCSP